MTGIQKPTRGLMAHRLRKLALAGAIGIVMGCAQSVTAEEQINVADNVYGNYLSGLHAARESNFPLAAKFLDAALVSDPDNMTLTGHAFDSNWRGGNMARADELARKIDAGVEGGLPGFIGLYLGLNALNAGDVELADAYFKRARPDNLSIRVLEIAKAWILAEQGKQEEALDKVRKARGLSPLIIDILEGKLHERFGNLAAAETAYMGETANPLELSVPLLRAIVRVKVKQGDFTGARTLLADYLDRNPGLPELEDDMSRLMKDQTLPFLTEGSIGAIAEGTYLLSRAFARTSWEASMDLARLASHLDPNLAESQLLLAALLEQRQRYQEAAAVYAMVKPDNLYHWEAQLSAAANLYHLDRKEEALDQLAALSVERPGKLDALENIAIIHQREENFDEMADTYDRLIARLPGDKPVYWRYYFRRGIAYNAQDRWDEAEKDFQHALRLYPDQPDVLNYLAYSWLELHQNLDKALEMLHRAVEQRRTGYIIDSLGWAYYRLGRYDEAVVELEKAVMLEPLEPEINDHLGDAYWKVGRKREARYQWERVLSLEPTKEVPHEEVERKLRDGLPDDS